MIRPAPPAPAPPAPAVALPEDVRAALVEWLAEALVREIEMEDTR